MPAPEIIHQLVAQFRGKPRSLPLRESTTKPNYGRNSSTRSLRRWAGICITRTVLARIPRCGHRGFAGDGGRLQSTGLRLQDRQGAQILRGSQETRGEYPVRYSPGLPTAALCLECAPAALGTDRFRGVRDLQLQATNPTPRTAPPPGAMMFYRYTDYSKNGTRSRHLLQRRRLERRLRPLRRRAPKAKKAPPKWMTRS